MGNQQQLPVDENNYKQYSEKEITNLISRMMLKRNKPTFSETINFNDATLSLDDEFVGGSRELNAQPFRNRYDRYNYASFQNAGAVDSLQNSDINSDLNQFNNLKAELERVIDEANNTINMNGGGCPCEGNTDNISVNPKQSGGAKDKKDKKKDDEDDDEDEEDEDDETAEDLADELDEDIDEMDSEPESESESESESKSSEQSRPKHKKTSKKTSKKTTKKHRYSEHDEYSLTDSNSSTINIVPFYSTPSDSEYYTHLRNKNRFS
jgi:hypothetical protein